MIQKTVGGTDGWCFFSCRPVSRKIIEVFVLMRSKMWDWRYRLLGDGCKQTRFCLPGYWKTILCVAKKKQCEGRKDLWAEFRVLWHHFKILNADFIVHTKYHLNWLDDSKPTRQGGSISTIPNSIDFLKKKESLLLCLDSTSSDSHPKTVSYIRMNPARNKETVGKIGSWNRTVTTTSTAGRFWTKLSVCIYIYIFIIIFFHPRSSQLKDKMLLNSGNHQKSAFHCCSRSCGKSALISRTSKAGPQCQRVWASYYSTVIEI